VRRNALRPRAAISLPARIGPLYGLLRSEALPGVSVENAENRKKISWIGGTTFRSGGSPRMTKHAFIVSCLLVASAEAAMAQAPPALTTPPAETAPAASANTCAPTKPVPLRGMIAPEPTTTGQAGETLGDKLARSDGVLCPPAGVDPEIRAPTPDAGNTPVIPPPGSPGGNPNLRPK
jgi:hypothetical protein